MYHCATQAIAPDGAPSELWSPDLKASRRHGPCRPHLSRVADSSPLRGEPMSAAQLLASIQPSFVWAAMPPGLLQLLLLPTCCCRSCCRCTRSTHYCRHLTSGAAQVTIWLPSALPLSAWRCRSCRLLCSYQMHLPCWKFVPCLTT